jgi:hypothetical protein
VRFTLSDHYADLDAAYDRILAMSQRYEDAAERAGVKLYDRLRHIRGLPETDRQKAITELVAELVAEKGGYEWLDSAIEMLSQDVDEAPTHLVMRWAGETEYLP